MADFILVNGSTKIPTKGLTPDQIAKVKAISSKGGNYGGKGLALAKTFMAQNAKGQGAGVGTTTGTTGATGPDLGINDKTGAINSTVATETLSGAEKQDFQTNFNTNNPGSQTNADGSSQTIERDPVTGEVKINQTGGGAYNAINSAFTGATTGLTDDGRKAAQDANYSYITQHYAGDKAKEMEAKKQELAERGIPIDASPGSLWSQTLEGIDRKYQSLDDQAKNQAITTGNQTYATNVGAVGTLGNTLAGQSPTFTAFQGATSNQAGTLQSALNSIAGFDAQKYATDKTYKAQMDSIAVEKMKVAKMGSGGGGGSGSGDSDIILQG